MPDKAFKKQLEEIKDGRRCELLVPDAEIRGVAEIPTTPEWAPFRAKITRINFAHNKLSSIPESLAESLSNLEYLNFSNNHINQLPTNISTLPRLKYLNLSYNRLDSLPRGFGAFPALEILDVSYNNISEHTLPKNFYMLAPTLRALYISDNDFEVLPEEILRLINLKVLALRGNDLISLPDEFEAFTKLVELYLDYNRLQILPPSLARVPSLADPQEGIFRASENPWISQLADQFQRGNFQVFSFIQTEMYANIWTAYKPQKLPRPDKSKKSSRRV